MWISRKLVNKSKNELAENGKVTIANAEVNATKQNRNFETYTPYGMSYVLPTGTSVLMVPSTQGGVCCGVQMEQCGTLKPGEIRIKSLGGGYIYIKNDGAVEINGIKIDKYGKIYCKEVVSSNG